MKTQNNEVTGYLIDPETRTITEINYTHSFNNLYALLNCRLVECVYLEDNVIYLDDEGLLTSDPKFYCIDNERIYAGKSMLLGNDPNNIKNGIANMPRISLAEAKDRITFLSTEEVLEKLDL